MLCHGIIIAAHSVRVSTPNFHLKSLGFRQGESYTQVTQPVNVFRAQRGPEGMGLGDNRVIEDKAQGGTCDAIWVGRPVPDAGHSLGA